MKIITWTVAQKYAVACAFLGDALLHGEIVSTDNGAEGFSEHQGSVPAGCCGGWWGLENPKGQLLHMPLMDTRTGIWTGSKYCHLWRDFFRLLQGLETFVAASCGVLHRECQ